MNSLIKTTFNNDPFSLIPTFFGDDFFRDFRDDFASRGFKKIIPRPHDFVNVKDKDGNVIGQRLSLVYTPFKKDQIKVTVLDDVLTVAIGGETKKEDKDDSGEILYRGISTQSTRFSIHLTDAVDQEAIKVHTDEGVLHIDLPFRKEPRESKQIELPVE